MADTQAQSSIAAELYRLADESLAFVGISRDTCRLIADDLTHLAAENERLREALRGLNAHVERMQRAATDYLMGPPRGLNSEQFRNAMIGLLDGPDQRRVQGAASAALSPEAAATTATFDCKFDPRAWTFSEQEDK